MKVALATVWRPRGEEARLHRLRGQLDAVHGRIAVTVPPIDDVELARSALAGWSSAVLVTYPERFAGRYRSIAAALEGGPDHVHYADFAMLTRWVEMRADEWRRTVDAIRTTDCLVTGRSERANLSARRGPRRDHARTRSPPAAAPRRWESRRP